MKKELLLFSFCCAFLSSFVLAQVKTNFNNNVTVSSSTGRFSRSYLARDIELPVPDIQPLLDKEKNAVPADGNKLLQIAQPVPADIDVTKVGNWTTDEQFAYGKLTIHARKAQSLSVNFDRFYLPASTVLYVYNENGNMITGPVTETENNATNVWGSWVYKGEYLTVEVRTPLATRDKLQLHISNVAYGYKEIYRTKVFNFGASGACNVNVLCPLGNGWAAERNSVAMVLGDLGGALCSGAMVINNGCTTTPYFLTANHCFNTSPQQNVALWRFTFQAWSPTCDPSQNSDGVTFNGSTLRANWASSDFCLVELNTTPPANSGIRYAGWTKSLIPASNATGIHHPAGDVMKISRANNAVTRGSFGGSTNQHWQANWSTGVTEGGSSGSPLFDQDHRIIGQLSGGPSACGGTSLWDFYGSIDKSWAGGGANASRLSNWLDPNNTGIIEMNTTDISILAGPGTPPAPTVTAVRTSAAGEPTTYEFTATQLSCVTYNWYVNGGLQQSSAYNKFDWYFPCNATRTITCSVTSAFGTSPLSAGVSRTGGCERTRIALSPNPATNTITVSTANASMGAFDEIRIYDYQGNLKRQQKFSKARTATINISGLAFGTYFVEISHGAEKERQILFIRK